MVGDVCQRLGEMVLMSVCVSALTQEDTQVWNKRRRKIKEAVS